MALWLLVKEPQLPQKYHKLQLLASVMIQISLSDDHSKKLAKNGFGRDWLWSRISQLVP